MHRAYTQTASLMHNHNQQFYVLSFFCLLASSCFLIAGSTLQIGDISVIASATGIDTIGDFRTADVAAGGQGAPLVPMADYALFRSETHTRIMLNIGGIANITLLPAGCGPEHVRAFDTGPGNMLMDALVSLDATAGLRYDVDGKMAARGCVSQSLLDEMLQVKSASLSLGCFFSGLRLFLL